MNLPAEHGRYPCRTQPLRKREEVVIQIPATARQWQLVAKPDVELDRQRAVYRSESRRRRGLGIVQELAQLDLARASGAVPAGQLRDCAKGHTVRRAAVQRRHDLILVRNRLWAQRAEARVLTHGAVNTMQRLIDRCAYTAGC